MPIYHFNVHNGRDTEDVSGTDLPNDEAAWLEAIRLAGSIMKDEASHMARDETWRVEVTDEAGVIRYRVDIRAADIRAAPGDT